MDRVRKANLLLHYNVWREEKKHFFETYETRKEAEDAWKNVSHTFVALCILLGETDDEWDYNDEWVAGLFDDWFGSGDEDDDERVAGERAKRTDEESDE